MSYPCSGIHSAPVGCVPDAEIDHVAFRNKGEEDGNDTKHFFQMTQDWIRMQDLDEIIPPGHF
jgi:hypothetical protein